MYQNALLMFDSIINPFNDACMWEGGSAFKILWRTLKTLALEWGADGVILFLGTKFMGAEKAETPAAG